MYELTLETKGYNRCTFVFEHITELTDFLQTALVRAIDEDVKAIIKVREEGRCGNE